MAAKLKPITAQQNKFMDLFVQYVCIENLPEKVAYTRAAKEVGYRYPANDGWAIVHGNRFPALREEIERRISINRELKRNDELKVDAERITKELAKIAFHNPKTIVNSDGLVKDLQDMDDDTASAMQVVGVVEVIQMGPDGKVKSLGYKPKYKPYNKIAALDQLALCSGMQANKGANQYNNKQVVNVQWAEIFGPAAAPNGGQGGGSGGDGGSEPDELEKRINAELAGVDKGDTKALPVHTNGKTNSKFDQKSSDTEEDEYT